MKVAINKCFGGFGLSPEAVKRIAELKGRECYFFIQDIHVGLRSPYIPATLEQAKEAYMFWAFSVPNPNEVLKGFDDWDAMPIKERRARNKQYSDLEISNREYERNDPHLIQAIEELNGAAGGSYSKLAIVEIPDDVEFTIEEYDGLEHVAEKHQTWG